MIREINSKSDAEVDLVATRMRATLGEVVDPEAGPEMFTMDWLRARVRWHLDGDECEGQVFLAEGADGEVLGHTIVRIEVDEAGRPFGLFSTFYVAPRARRAGIGSALLARGEAWMRARGLGEASTLTAETNAKLIALCQGRGYTLGPGPPEMVRLSRALEDGGGGRSSEGAGVE